MPLGFSMPCNAKGQGSSASVFLEPLYICPHGMTQAVKFCLYQTRWRVTLYRVHHTCDHRGRTPGGPKVLCDMNAFAWYLYGSWAYFYYCADGCNALYLASVLWLCWLSDRKGIHLLKSWVLVCWWWLFEWSFTCLIALIVTTTTIFAPVTSIMVTFWYLLTHIVLENGW